MGETDTDVGNRVFLQPGAYGLGRLPAAEAWLWSLVIRLKDTTGKYRYVFAETDGYESSLVILNAKFASVPSQSSIPST